MTKRVRGLSEMDTPGKGDTVMIDGQTGIVTRRSLDGSACWAVFPGSKNERMFTHRRAINKFREFPENTSGGSLTLGNGTW